MSPNITHYEESLDACPECSILDKDEQTALFIEYARTHSPEIRNQLLTHNLKLVRTIAQKYVGATTLSKDELISEGIDGLLKAIDMFDPSKDNAFTTYAYSWITSYIKMFMKKNTSQLTLSSWASTMLARLSNARLKISQERRISDDEITAEDLAEELQVPLDKVKEFLMWERSNFVCQLDEPIIGKDDPLSLSEVLPSDELTPEQQFDQNSNIEKVHAVLAKLDPSHAQVLFLKYGLDIGRPRILQEVVEARELLDPAAGRSVEGVRQLLLTASKEFLRVWKELYPGQKYSGS